MYKVTKIKKNTGYLIYKRQLYSETIGPIFEELQEALYLYISFHLSMQGVEVFQ